MAQSCKFVAKKNAWDGLGLAMKIYLPLSIISFFNEAINGQFCMWHECDYPPYYAVPRILAMLFGAEYCKSCKARFNPSEKLCMGTCSRSAHWNCNVFVHQRSWMAAIRLTDYSRTIVMDHNSLIVRKFVLGVNFSVDFNFSVFSMN